jgi:hypothetical protein
MHTHPYLLQLMGEEHTRELMSAAAASRLTRDARLDRRARSARHAAAVLANAGDLLRLQRPRQFRQETAHRAA